jgi:tRNA(Arg) A34 adenosine deaminase TadA
MADPCPMCLAAMYYCSPLKATFITFRDEYKEYYRDDRKYFTFEDFYKELSKSWQERNLTMIYHSAPEAMEVFKLWKKMND